AVGVVVLARTIGAGPRAELAADARVRVDQHDAVLGPFVGGARWTDRHARRGLAVQARAGEVHRPARRPLPHLVAVDAVEPRPERVGAVGVLVGQRRRVAARIPFLAARRAGLAADAGVEVDDEAKLLGRCFGQRGHSAASRNSAPKEDTAMRTSPPGLTSRSNRGQVSPASSGFAFSICTRRSYQAACPVTGSLLEKR